MTRTKNITKLKISVEQNKQVYSSSPKQNESCSLCRELKNNCVCPSTEKVDLAKIVAILSIEKSGRAGKMVSVICQLPKSPELLKELLSELKQKCGAGGTSYIDAKKQGCIEIQGEQRAFLRDFFVKKGIRVKG